MIWSRISDKRLTQPIDYQIRLRNKRYSKISQEVCSLNLADVIVIGISITKYSYHNSWGFFSHDEDIQFKESWVKCTNSLMTADFETIISYKDVIGSMIAHGVTKIFAFVLAEWN